MDSCGYTSLWILCGEWTGSLIPHCHGHHRLQALHLYYCVSFCITLDSCKLPSRHSVFCIQRPPLIWLISSDRSPFKCFSLPLVYTVYKTTQSNVFWCCSCGVTLNTQLWLCYMLDKFRRSDASSSPSNSMQPEVSCSDTEQNSPEQPDSSPDTQKVLAAIHGCHATLTLRVEKIKVDISFLHQNAQCTCERVTEMSPLEDQAALLTRQVEEAEHNITDSTNT